MGAPFSVARSAPRHFGAPWCFVGFGVFVLPHSPGARLSCLLSRERRGDSPALVRTAGVRRHNHARQQPRGRPHFVGGKPPGGGRGRRGPVMTLMWFRTKLRGADPAPTARPLLISQITAHVHLRGGSSLRRETSQWQCTRGASIPGYLALTGVSVRACVRVFCSVREFCTNCCCCRSAEGGLALCRRLRSQVSQ